MISRTLFGLVGDLNNITSSSFKLSLTLNFHSKTQSCNEVEDGFIVGLIEEPSILPTYATCSLKIIATGSHDIMRRTFLPVNAIVFL
ncbi:hypothetical protein WICPIJ_007643 [Wickerhamomyces pijperi]|uniref:Uncharacterized protein n=1 Tax=Wickerhamomyces pijperi TaxID=599730 RepID=A0A9P8Q236_WICPI|nr:hypothetical protein WICPIJ_007643 [Wickerhamomyces pijperi]